LAWLPSLPFAACAKDSLFCNLAFLFTDSAGKTGTPIIILLLAFCFILEGNTFKNRIYIFGKTIIVMATIIALNAILNEHLTKEAFQIPRPAHSKLCTYCNPTIKPASIYQGDADDRKKNLTELIRKNKSHLTNFDTKVLDHWVEECGYSFPSGHSFNAFLLASIMSYSLYHSRKGWTKNFTALPFIWAIFVGLSRIALGAHSALDVSIGALAGIIVGMTLLYFQTTRKLIMHRSID